MIKTTFLDTDSLDCGDIDFAPMENQSLQLGFWKQTSPEQTRERIQSAEIIISNKVILDADVLKNSKLLKLICIAATGVNNVDLDFARQQGIGVCNVTGYATASVVQHVFALMTSLQSRLAEHRGSVFNGEWSRSDNFCVLNYPYEELNGKTLGIIGYGELGQAVAKVGRGFGMKVLVAESSSTKDIKRSRNNKMSSSQSNTISAQSLYNDSLQQLNEPECSSIDRIPFERLLSESDVVSLHCPLADNTRYLINADAFKMMKSTAMLINTARGGIVNEPDLLDALKCGAIAGAALDVLEVEPPPANHILLAYDKPNLILTPHVAWASRESRQRLVDQLGLNIQAFLKGKVRNSVL